MSVRQLFTVDIDVYNYVSVGESDIIGNSTLTVGLVYRSPNISTDDNEKIQNAIKEVSKRDCIIMGDFNHGNLYRVLGVKTTSF